MKYFWYGPLAQLVEQLTLNQRVAGSSPSRPIGCQTHGTGKCWCESISKTFMLFHFFVYNYHYANKGIFLIRGFIIRRGLCKTSKTFER